MKSTVLQQQAAKEWKMSGVSCPFEVNLILPWSCDLVSGDYAK